MRKKKLLKASILAASFAALVPMATLDVFAEETDETAVVAEADGGDTEEESPKLAPSEKNGWVEEDGGWRYYKDGEYLAAGIYLIGSDYYCFKWNGIMYDDESFSALGFFYRAKPGGKLYRNTWVEANGGWYYYQPDCAAAEGLLTLNGKQYLFNFNISEYDDYNGGRLQTDTIKKFEGTWYVTDGDGIATALPTKDGLTQVNGESYYIQDGAPVSNTIVQVGNDYYGFDYNYKMYKNSWFGVYDTELEENCFYRAGSDGKLLTNTWYQEAPADSKHYYGADGKAASGLVTIDGKWYLFEAFDNGLNVSQAREYFDLFLVIDENGVCTPIESGWAKCGKYYYYFKEGQFLRDTIEKIGNEYYGFDGYGRMYDNTDFYMWDSYYRAKSGGALYRNAWYYNYFYHSNGAGAEGLKTIGGKQYYFENGKAVQGCFFLIEGELYHAEANCVVAKVTKDGFYYHDANRYQISYVSGGKVVKNAWKKIGGKYYYFDEDGLAYTAGTYEIGGKYYLFDHDGVMASAGWKQGNTVYVTSSGALATGDQKINNVWYYFNHYGDKQTGMVETETGLFLYAADGSYIGKATGNGWNEIKGTYYYVHSDGTLAAGLETIGKYEYFFDYYNMGQMVTDQVRWIDGGKPAMFKSNGQRLQNGWYQVHNDWFYAENGILAYNTTKTISGKKYTFDYNGAMITSSVVKDKKLVTVGSNGIISSEKKMADGWTLADGSYYYYKNGAPFTGWVGDYYIEKGVMQRNSVVAGWYWVNYDGKYQKTAGWAYSGVPGDRWETGYYVKKGGKIAANEWVKIDGEWYYFNEYGTRANGVEKINGTYYIFSMDGVLLKTVGAVLPNGWVQAGDEYYYFDCGDFVYGDLEIKGKVYSFYASRMLTDEISDYSGYNFGYYVDKTGAAQTSYKGWKMVNGSWYYFAENNKASKNGWTTQGTAQYCVEYGMVTGTRVISGKLYTFNANGALIKEHSVQNGWYLYEGEYYYFRDGRVLTQELVTDKGKTYLIGSDGKMVKNGSDWGYNASGGNDYYADANGVIVKSTWKKVKGRDRYFDAQGRMLYGIQKINGKIYYFD